MNHNFRARGTFFRNFHLARVLAERGYEATLLTVSPTRTLVPSVETYRGVRLVQTPQFLVPTRFAASGFCPFDTLFRCVRAGLQRFDVVFVSDHLPNVALPFLSARLLHPETIFVADWADLFTEGGLHEHWNTPLGRPFYRASYALERGLKRSADLCTATSRPLLKLLRDQLDVPAWRTLHLPSGCDPRLRFPESRLEARRALGLPADALIVGRTCSSEWMSDPEIDAMLALADRYQRLTGQELEYYFIGPSNPKRYPRMFGSSCRIRCTGRLKPEEVPAHLGACDLFLLVEPDDANSRARGPIRLNDYLAAGRPLVCNSVGDHVVTLTAHDACVVCDDFGGANPALDTILTNPALREDMGRRARSLAEGELAWDNLGRRLESLILQYVSMLQRAREELTAASPLSAAPAHAHAA